MLGKLIKHEWKNMYKVGCGMLLSILVVTVIGCIMLRMPWMEALFLEKNTLTELQELLVVYTLIVSFVLYIVMLLGITYGLLIYQGLRFYRTMYTGQGYLTHTLPVTPHQLLLSKILVSGAWYVLTEIAVIFSVIALIVSFASGLFVAEGFPLMGVIRETSSELRHLFRDTEVIGAVIHFLLYMVFAVLLAPFCTLTMVFGSLTIGQMSSKHKGLVGILTYFGITTAMSVIMMIVQMVFSFLMSMEFSRNPMGISRMNMMGTYDVTLALQVLLAVGLYWLSWFILKKKLNLE